MLKALDNAGTVTWPQPWATLIVEGLKTLEATNLPAEPELIGQRMRIMAATNASIGVIAVPTKRLLDRALRERGWILDCLPRGVVVGDVRLTGCYEAVSGVVNGRIALGQQVEGSPGKVRSVHVGRREEHTEDKCTEENIGARTAELLRCGQPRPDHENCRDRYLKGESEGEEYGCNEIKKLRDVRLYLHALRRDRGKKVEHQRKDDVVGKRYA